MKSDAVFDAVIVGAGATGTLAAYELCSAGLRVCLLDASDRKAAAKATLANYAVQRHCHAFDKASAHGFINDKQFPYHTSSKRPFYWIRNHALGGRLNIWARACMRMSDRDFSAGWPISLRELAPYYQRVESFLALEPDATPDANGHYAASLLRRQGIALAPQCKSGVDAQHFLQMAKSTGRLTLLQGMLAQSVAGHQGTATGVRVINKRTRRETLIRGRFAFLCASALESTRILLNSKIKGESPALGRYLMDHVSGRTGVSMLGYFKSADQRDTFSERPPQYFHVLHPNFTTYVYLHEQRFGVTLFHIYSLGEMLPRRQNRVRLDPKRSDHYGIPTLTIDAKFSSHERTLEREIAQVTRRIATSLIGGKQGGKIVTASRGLAPLGLNCHEAGTCRMGNDPATSVVDGGNQHHVYRNLFVTDGSSFPRQGAANPTLTMMALTSRASDLVCGSNKFTQL